MRKLFILSLLAMMIAWGIGGCGGGIEGTSADPLGTDSIMFEDAAGGTVSPNGALALKATVKNAAGTAVVRREVSFGFVSNASGATLTSYSANTNGAGEATILYRAGATAGFDVVRASISNGATMDVSITVGGGTGPYQMTLAADNKSLAAGQTATITATVKDGSSNPAVGITVTFTLPVNESGASFSDAGVSVPQIQVPTDASGNAVAIYKAGSNDSLAAVYDTVRGALANGSSNAVSITRSAEIPPTPTPGEPLSIAVVAQPTPVTAGQVCIVTATLTGDDKVGVTVTFSLPVNNSGASLSASSAITDGSGNAVVTYTAGSNNPTQTVSDTVRAAVGSISSSAAITRTGSATTTYAVSIGASATSVTAGQVSIITATVTSGSAPAGGVTVSFTLPVNSSGATLSAATATTDSSGKAVVIYQPGTTSPTLTVQDTVQAAVGSATDTKAITRTGSAASAYGIAVTASPTTVPAAGGSSVIKANVTNNLGTAISGVTVNFAQAGGTSVLPAASITDGSGNAVSVFTGPGGLAGTQAGVVTASITIGVNTYTAAVVISY